MFKYMVLTIVVLGLLLTGCQKAELPPPPGPAPGPVPDTDITIDKEIQEVNTIDDELNMDDLEGIEKDLDSVDW